MPISSRGSICSMMVLSGGRVSAARRSGVRRVPGTVPGSVRPCTTRGASPAGRRHRACEERVEGRLRARVGVGGAQEAVRRMVAEVDAGELPNELLDIEVAPDVPQLHRAPDELDQEPAPFAFHLEYLVPDLPLHV